MTPDTWHAASDTWHGWGWIFSQISASQLFWFGIDSVLMILGLFYKHLRDWLINSLSDLLVKISSKHSQSQTGRARELKFWENVHPTLCVMCHVSDVGCHVSRVTCNFSLVTCHLSHVQICFLFFFTLIFFDKVVELVCGGFVFNGAYSV